MKIAIISDIHGNLEALKTVLADIKSRGIDKLYCLGDILAKGTHQQECVDLLRENCEVIIKGNCDVYYTTDYDLSKLPDEDVKKIKWNRSKLNDESREYISRLPYSYEFYLSGRLVRLLHSHPERIDKFVGNIDDFSSLYELVLSSENTITDKKADILIYGHIHTPFIQKIYNRYIMNPGSVGNPIDVIRNDIKDADVKNTTVANYLILTGNLDSLDINDSISYELVCIPYDIDKELEDNQDNIELEKYKIELKEGKYRNMEKIYESFKKRGIDKEKI